MPRRSRTEQQIAHSARYRVQVTRRGPDALVAALPGKIDNEESEEVGRLLIALVDAAVPVRLDLSQTSGLDTGAVAALFRMLRAARQASVPVTAHQPGPGVREALHTSGLDRAMDCTDQPA
ncbi:STAS domain-containing protein [Streptacidiphilus carbonis]|uniref:STAS domain-containing protein n=1 Tax=Streptacidiphilus carbonis TaxID=105422 RepID=UPI0005A77D53|nr:STAS domain-containing protein [Streptacidiphilus carbonis]